MGSDYRQLFKLPVIKWCDMMAGEKTKNSVLKSILKSLQKMAPQFFRSCPFFGRFEMLNQKPNKGLMSMYPPGITRFRIVAVEMKKVTLTLSVFTEIFK
jgi:hypothetical protein